MCSFGTIDSIVCVLSGSGVVSGRSAGELLCGICCCCMVFATVMYGICSCLVLFCVVMQHLFYSTCVLCALCALCARIYAYARDNFSITSR